MCFNRKVIAGLAGVAIFVVMVAPALLSRALPLLFLTACPLSMFFRMRGMGWLGDVRSTDGANGTGEACGEMPMQTIRVGDLLSFSASAAGPLRPLDHSSQKLPHR